MCQIKVLEILSKRNKWMTARQIKKEIDNISLGSIQTNLKKLREHKFVETKKSKITTKTNVRISVTKYRVIN